MQDRTSPRQSEHDGREGEPPGRYAHGVTRREPAPAPGSPVPAVPQQLTFPDFPRLELDQLLGQLVERAQEVIATQGRLRGLLHANQLVIGDLALPAVLRQVVEAARELVGARYAALGVISPAGGLAEFVHTGMPQHAVERIGHLPQGKGLLGALIDDPRPIRLRHIADDERSSGFPSGHPPMQSFLGVPIRIRDEVFGNLYLTESENGEFTAEDEQLITAIAATAAVAIDNAHHYESARTRGKWLQASATITREILSPQTGDANRPLQLIAERACEIADADLVVVALPTDGELHIEVAVGARAEDLPGTRLPLATTPSGRVFTTGTPLRVADLDEEPDLAWVALGGLEVGPVLIVPLIGSRGVQGVLSAARMRGRTAFSAKDLEMATSFANHGAIAIELAEARAEQQRIAMLDERDRIAADLHDHVIQRLFAAGLSLQSVATGLGPGPMTDRVLATVADLDTTISQIRTTIFQLHDRTATASGELRARLLDVATGATRALSFEPAVRFTGAVETLPADIAEDLAAVLREALTNVARHARANTAEVDLVVRPDRLVLSVRDDGVGMPPTLRHSGLANMRRRAERHGGTLEIGGRDPRGTLLVWSVPGA
jgi:signal transduction histidine kinase